MSDVAKEVMKNVCDFVMSYNFDDSDPMTDYFCTNFYLTLGVGTYKKPYKVELPKLDCKGKKPDVFKHPVGAAHKAIRQALGGTYFSFHNSQQLQGKMVLGEDSYGHNGDKYFWPLSYSSAKTAQKRMDKLEKAGIRCKLTGYNGGCIEFLGSLISYISDEKLRETHIDCFASKPSSNSIQGVPCNSFHVLTPVMPNIF